MKLGIDLTRIEGENTCGADAVAINLIRGLVMCGHSKDIVCFCRGKIVPILTGIDPSLTVKVLPDFTSRSGIIRFIKRGKESPEHRDPAKPLRREGNACQDRKGQQHKDSDPCRPGPPRRPYSL